MSKLAFNVCADRHAGLGGLLLDFFDGGCGQRQQQGSAAVILCDFSKNRLVLVRGQMIFGPLAGRIIRNQTDSFSACPMGSLQLLGIAGIWTALPVDEKLPGFLLVEGFLYPRKITAICAIAPCTDLAGGICIVELPVYNFLHFVFSSLDFSSKGSKYFFSASFRAWMASSRRVKRPIVIVRF